MPDFTQQTFLNASICSFNANIGWGNQVSTLQVSLVEDDKQNDYFDPPPMGYPCSFFYDEWRFDGLLNNIEYVHGQGSNRTINITLVDPRQILEGVQIILNGYSGSINGIYNLYNVYGYLESFGYGRSQVNNAGMPWYLLTTTLDSMIDNYPIRHLGVPFFIDLSELPINSQNYRVQGNSLSLMDLIADLCETANCDFFITLVGNVIKLRTISRTYQPLMGRIQDFIDSLGQVAEKRVGFEAEYHPVGKFLVGAQVESLYYAYNGTQFRANPKTDADLEEYSNPSNYVLSYWGKYDNGNVVQTYRQDASANLLTDSQIFMYLPAQGLDLPGFGFGSYYTSSLGEMDAALAGFESWRRFLCNHDPDTTSVHFGKATRLKMASLNVQNLKAKLQALNDNQLNALKPTDIFDLGKVAGDLTAHEIQQRFFSFVQNYAEEYYGKKFMVKLPQIYAAIESESGLLKTSVSPIDSGYVDESLFASAVSRGLLPQFFNFLLDDQNKIQAYVRFDGLYVLDMSDLNPEDYVIQGDSIFVRCTVEPQLVFLNAATASGPRAVITLPGIIKAGNFTDYSGIGFQIFREALNGIKTDAQIDAIIDKIKKRPGMETFYDHTVVSPLFPRFAAVPLRSNISTYGPWYTYNYYGGAMEYEQNEDLAPWNFGGYTGMNTAALASVSEAQYNRNISESGNFTVPGAPTVNLGSLLISLGPYVTGVSVSVGDDGVTSTYDLNSWSVRPGKMQRYQIDKFKDLCHLRQQNSRLRAKFFGGAKTAIGSKAVRVGQAPKVKKRPKPKKHLPHTSSGLIVGEVVGSGSDTESVLAIAPLYNAQLYIEDDTNYMTKGAMSLDGLFRPFTTDTTATNMPHFVEPDEEAAEPTVEDLNPLKVGHDISVILTGDTRPEDLVRDPLENATEAGGRGIALKGPVVIAGHGYDINGEPVGSIGNMSTWKCGPLDTRWDNDRGVWTSGDSVQVKSASLNIEFLGNDGISTVSSGNATVSGVGSVTVYDSAGRNFLLNHESFMVIKSGSRWEIMGENGLMRRGTANTEISFGASGPCTCDGHIINATSDVGGDPIEAGDSVILRYYPGSGWYIIGADCPDE